MGAIIKTGVCSYGMSGKLFHAPFIQNHPGYELTGIVERHNNDSREPPSVPRRGNLGCLFFNCLLMFLTVS